MKHFLWSPLFAALIVGCASTPPPESVVGDYLSGRLAARTNAVGAAASAFEGAQSDQPLSDEILRSAFFYGLASGDIEGAAALSPRVLGNDDPDDDDLARLALAARELKAGAYDGARAVLAPGAQVSDFSAALTILEAWARVGAQGPEAGLRALAEKQEDSFRGFHPLHQAFMFESAGLSDEARTAYQLSLMSYGGAVGRDAYGAFLERTGDVDAAREHYELLAQYRGPDRQIALHGLARIDAGTSTKHWAAVSPAEGAAVALFSFGSTILQQSFDQRSAAQKAGFRVGDPNFDMPLAFVQTALYLAPDFDHAQRLAGSILNSYGNNESAIAVLRRVKASSAFYEQAQIEVANGLMALNRDDEALSVLRTAARSNEAGEAQFYLASHLAAMERHREAVAVFDKLIDALPENPPEDSWRFYIGRAASLMKLNAWPRAEGDLIRAVEIAPKEPVALNYLGYSWVERGQNLDKAFAMIEQAVALEPNSGAYIDSLGWAHYQRGDFETAVGHLEHAASLEPSDPTMTDHLGDVYWRLDRKIEARYQWRHVLILEPDDALRASVQAKLRTGLPDGDE